MMESDSTSTTVRVDVTVRVNRDVACDAMP